MSDELASAIAHSLAMSYGSHISAPRGGKDWRAAEDLQPIIAAEIRRAKAEELREAAEKLDHSTDADVNNYIGRPRPTYSHSDRYADVRWLELRADQIEDTP